MPPEHHMTTKEQWDELRGQLMGQIAKAIIQALVLKAQETANAP